MNTIAIEITTTIERILNYINNNTSLQLHLAATKSVQ